jgi:hypothetical protein
MVAKKRRLPVSSSGLVEELRSELHEYHVTVTSALATMTANCKHCRKQIEGLDLEINGENPEREDAPGIKAEVKAQRAELKSVRKGIHTTWVVITTLASICGGWFTLTWKR